MQNKQIIEILKEQYSRDIRKQLVKNILKHEKNDDKEAIESSYNIINQIFSYVMSELGWTFSQDSNSWDDTPLKIMQEVFPNIDKTKWFDSQLLQVKASVGLKANN
ncbi:hypothetical protein FJR48_06075 [Sulfurimonas lithotrophica]|uniref:Uncharacterized protein n=1 Tax=Sulfurimonas lithotrophica TaxID=2590022 RepID=A0A5P8P0R5_9BACT|nr:hypothetical protein [Sulfurimonas lithotrophica]QFR49316.1 hypothetical protein FJR48_06075 [Sulfurimonas lithotrophica]